MKIFRYIIALFVCFVLMSFRQGDPGDPGAIHVTWHLIVALLAGVYEVIVRIIPSVGNYSWIAKIIQILTWISDFLNRKKK